ncbi:hypothetical protein F5144DRAFT_589559 [Chaetomium tenue]|uniref:Uncharacterized protein n=1 Tax=Chaetomium tenue TaxID=1854479 RepID=A0ACB7PSA5_9PEZI|nr:hypothetical protein F5144DRAFT_589559 [Chaetomium globosum]
MTVPVRHGLRRRWQGVPPPQFPLFPIDTGPANPAPIDCQRTDDWIERFLSIVNTSISETSTRLKVAVLGTGIDVDHPDFYDEDRFKTENARSWVASAPTVDSNGHGTHVVSTILALTQNVDVYVAKISEGNSQTLESAESVAEAIRVANEEWDVDIISIPFGLPRAVPRIQDEIEKAVHHKKIIFAAAADNGANTGRSYPATQPGVICVHSANGLGNASLFNPTELPTADNFCVLGEHVEAAWPSPSPTTQLGGTRRMSGSATATSVAVAIAALMIAIIHDNVPEQDCAIWLKSYDGVRAIFRSLSEQRNGLYDLVGVEEEDGLGLWGAGGDLTSDDSKPGDFSLRMEDNPNTPDPRIRIYKILADGSLQAIDEGTPTSPNATDDVKSSADELYLVEGLSEHTITVLRGLIPSLPNAFVKAHLCDNLGQIDSALDEDHVFLAKWSRRAAQTKEVWAREKRLRTSKNPFNVDDVDPTVSRLDHDRYEHITEPYRFYNPISEYDINVPFHQSIEEGGSRTTAAAINEISPGCDIEGQHGPSDGEERSTAAQPGLRTKMYVQNMLMHAAHECISFYHVKLGNRIKVHYNLLILDTILTIVVEDQRKLLVSISKALDEIELSMGRDLKSPQSWRDFPPGWRNHLFHQSQTIAYFLARVPELSAPLPPTSRKPAQIRILERAEKELEATMRRLEGTYQVLMSSMSILESERAIEQAEVVTRLTNLAFFFVPLTFVSGIFGMNVVEFDQKLTVAMWVAISLGVTAATYFIRFRRPLVGAVHQTPQAIRRMRLDILAARMRRWAQVLRHLASDYNLIPLLLLGLMGVAVWLAATLPATDETRIGVIPSLAVITQLLEPGNIISNRLRWVRPSQAIIKLALFIGAAVGLWAIATSTLPIDTRIVLFTLTSSHTIMPAMMDSVAWCYLTPKLRVRLLVHPLLFDTTRAALCSVMGVALWKLFTSSLSDDSKIGVAIGTMAWVRISSWGGLAKAIALIPWGGVLGFLPIQAVATWKVSTAASLAVSLGNIILSPSRPVPPLLAASAPTLAGLTPTSTPTGPTPPPTDTLPTPTNPNLTRTSTTKHNVEWTRAQSLSHTLGVWSRFIQCLGIRLDFETSHARQDVFRFASVRTEEWFPSDEFLAAAVQDPGWGEGQVGVGEAGGVRGGGGEDGVGGAGEEGVDAGAGGADGGGGGCDGGVGAGGVGAAGGVKWERGESMEFEGGDDFVFAYRVRKVWLRGGGKGVGQDEYVRGKMLSESYGDGKGGKGDDMEDVVVEDLEDFDIGDKWSGSAVVDEGEEIEVFAPGAGK